MAKCRSGVARRGLSSEPVPKKEQGQIQPRTGSNTTTSLEIKPENSRNRVKYNHFQPLFSMEVGQIQPPLYIYHLLLLLLRAQQGDAVSYAKRQLARRKQRLSTGTLSKEQSVSTTECRQAEYLMRYGKRWMRRWQEDHHCDMTPYEGGSRKIIGIGIEVQISLAKPIEPVEGSTDKHPLVVIGYGSVDADGWVFHAMVTAMGDVAGHILGEMEISAVGTLRENPNGYQFSVRSIQEQRRSKEEHVNQERTLVETYFQSTRMETGVTAPESFTGLHANQPEGGH